MGSGSIMILGSLLSDLAYYVAKALGSSDGPAKSVGASLGLAEVPSFGLFPGS